MLRSALPTSRDARRILIGGLFAAIGKGLTLPFLLIYLTQVRGLQAGTVGALVGWMGLVALLLAPLGGSLIDKLGARRVVLPCFFVEAAGIASLAFVDSATSALLALTLVAVGGAALWSGQTTILAALVTAEERQRVFGLSFTLLNLGIGTGGLIAGSIVDVGRPETFQIIYFGDAASYLVPAAILLTLPGVGRQVNAARTSLNPDVQGPDQPSAGDVDRTGSSGLADSGRVQRAGYRDVLRDKVFLRFIIFGLVLTTCSYAQIEIGFTAFATVVADVPVRVIAWAFAGNTLLIVVAQLFVLRWLDGRSRARALALVGVIFAASWVILGIAGLTGSSGRVVFAAVGVIACSVVFAMGETLLSPIMPAITNSLATDELRGRYNAVGSMIWGVSAIVGPVAAGPLIGGGYSVAWLVMVIGGSVVASTLALALYRRLTPAQDGRVLELEVAMDQREVTLGTSDHHGEATDRFDPVAGGSLNQRAPGDREPGDEIEPLGVVGHR
ncbi:MAG TPA: MFS transporter [Micromonosporaceae bacterium]